MKRTTHLDPGRIRYWRELRGLTQQALGQAVLGTRVTAASSLRRIQHWEHHGRVWTRYAQALANALGVRLAQLSDSDADIDGLWLAWQGSATQPDGGTLHNSLHALLDRIFTDLPPRDNATDQAWLTYRNDHYLLTLRRRADSRRCSVQHRIRFRRVRWHPDRGLLWQRLRRLEQATAERLIEKQLCEEAVPMSIRRMHGC
ncbi:helix-turn-helix transcriptional regulator [Salinisphaera sp. T31B1]|uniref:helix-turn-helix transcriptional regulator n=1 Tax=Salinisphaera sp. T31B1 TaxID=727963 RepID=UPI003341CABA